MLEDYARRNGLPNPTHFTDDGVSGTRFDCPGFLAMMEEVEAGRVEAIVIKDMSRLGRDYPKVGQVMEILRQRGVRLIAQKQVDTIDMKVMREELKAVERLRKAATQLARQGQDKTHDRRPER